MSGRRCPAEFEPQAGVWLSWPHNEEDWPGKMDEVRRAFVELVRHITAEVDACLLIHDWQVGTDATRELEAGNIEMRKAPFITYIPTDRGWMRDIAPVFVDTEDVRDAITWTFNGWALYDNHKLDAQVSEKLHGFEAIRATHKDHPVVMEGGAYDVNGRGSILATRECLLDQETQCRNPGFTEDDYAQIFGEYLGAPHVIWLNRGIVGDDTHGHVDDIARFVTPDTIVCAIEPNHADANHGALAENLEILRDARDQDGKPLTIVEIPMPGPVMWEDERLPASYLNFLLCNDRVIVPVFGDPNDGVALKLIEEASGKRAVPIYAVDLVLGYGTVHCLTHQIPA